MIVTDDDSFAATCRAAQPGPRRMAWLAINGLGYN